jgi:hypothetical protein
LAVRPFARRVNLEYLDAFAPRVPLPCGAAADIGVEGAPDHAGFILRLPDPHREVPFGSCLPLLPSSLSIISGMGKGYAHIAMEDLTADAELTGGALYHQFGGEKGVLEAVIAQINAEASEQWRAVVEQAETPWDGLVKESVAWVELTLEPEIRRIVLLDSPAVLGDPSRWASQSTCLASTKRSIEMLVEQNVIKPVDPRR